MGKLWWFVLVFGFLGLGTLIGVIAVGDPPPEDSGEVVRRFMTGAGPFITVGGVALVAAFALDEQD